MARKSRKPNRDQYTVVLENIESKIDLIAEAIQPIPAIQQEVREMKDTLVTMQHTLNATFEAVGDLQVDTGNLKRVVQTHEQQIRSLQK